MPELERIGKGHWTDGERFDVCLSRAPGLTDSDTFEVFDDGNLVAVTYSLETAYSVLRERGYRG